MINYCLILRYVRFNFYEGIKISPLLTDQGVYLLTKGKFFSMINILFN